MIRQGGRSGATRLAARDLGRACCSRSLAPKTSCSLIDGRTRVRIASFNMRSGGSLGHWSAILDAAEPDILLVQESGDPAALWPDLFEPLDLRKVVWQPVGHGLWGSGLWVRDQDIQPLDVPGFEGWVVGGIVSFRESSLHVFSVHLPPESGSYVRAANSMLDALAPILDGAPVLLGGDWNLTVSRRDPTEERRHRPGELELLSRLEDEFRVRSAWRSAHPEGLLPQTLRWTRDPAAPYHCDGIFLPDAWTAEVKAAAVLASEMWEQLSDHNPLLASWAVTLPDGGEPAKTLGHLDKPGRP